MTKSVSEKSIPTRVHVFLGVEQFVDAVVNLVQSFVSFADLAEVIKMPKGAKLNTDGDVVLRLYYGSWKYHAENEVALDEVERKLRDLPADTVIEVGDSLTSIKVSESTNLNQHTTLTRLAKITLDYTEKSAKVSLFIVLKVKG